MQTSSATASLDMLSSLALTASSVVATKPTPIGADDPKRIHHDQRDALASRLRDEDVPVHLAAALETVRLLAGHGAPFDASEAYLARTDYLTETERSAILHAVHVRPAGETGDAHLPELDYVDLFGGSPAVVDQIRSVSELSASNSDLMALGALAAGSFALARKVTVTFPSTSWSTYTNLWVVPEAMSGRGKGPMLKQMGMSTLKRWQQVLVDRYADVIRADNRKREVLNEERSELAQASKKARKAGQLAEHEKLEKLIVDLDGHLATPERTEPYFVLNDVTPQAFVEACHGTGFVGMFHGEGEVVLRQFTAKSDTTDALGTLLGSWSVEDHDRRRIGNKGQKRPADTLTMSACILPMQPGTLNPSTPDAQETLAEMVRRGAFGRMIAARPRIVPLPEEYVESEITYDSQRRGAFDALLIRMCESASDLDPQRPLAPSAPAKAAFDDDAASAALRFQYAYKVKANPGGPMSDPHLDQIAQKFGEQAMRVAAVIAAFRVGSFGADGYRVTMDDWQRAVRFCEGYVLPHAVACAARVSGSAIDADADAVLAYLSTKGPTDLRSLRAHFRSWGLAAVNDRRTRFDAAVATLVSRSDVKLEDLPRKRVMVHVLRGGAS